MAYALIDIALLLLRILSWIIIAQIIISWLIAFNVINTYNDLVRGIVQALNVITEPLYRPIRRIMPDLGMIDLSPMVIFVLILIAQRLLVDLAMNLSKLDLAIRLTPRARKTRIGGCWVDAEGKAWLSAWVASPPDKGRANAALIDLLSGALNVPASAISLEAGATSRLKRLHIDGADQDLVVRLARLMEQS